MLAAAISNQEPIESIQYIVKGANPKREERGHMDG
jgi:hypothetical protein